ncbi:hypothetical protein [Neolewinella agarilytica]|uniref:hypothetical protein n=1 Tax=Neolewinella agarilytica TaxID=478744 RepID=UPI00235712A6|nr:hypothetical protein [Neolewinella agarilytica]
MIKIIRFFMLLCFLFSGYVASSQISLTVIVESEVQGEQLPGATVILYRGDSPQIQTFTATDNDGYGQLTVDSNYVFPSLLITRSLGYRPDTIRFEAPTSFKDTLSIRLLPLANFMESVIVKDTRRGIRVNGDTVVYSIDRFKLDSSEQLGEILERLPGVEKTDEGITYLGRPLNRFLIDGDDFASENGRALLTNLQAGDVDELAFSPQKGLRGNALENFEVDIRLESNRKNRLFGRANVAGGIDGKGLLGYLHQGFGMYVNNKKWFVNTASRNLGNPELQPIDYISLVGLSYAKDGLKIPRIYFRQQPIRNYDLSSVGVNGSLADKENLSASISLVGVFNASSLSSTSSVIGPNGELSSSRLEDDQESWHFTVCNKTEKRFSDSAAIHLSAGVTVEKGFVNQGSSTRVFNSIRSLTSDSEKNYMSVAAGASLDGFYMNKGWAHEISGSVNVKRLPENQLRLASADNLPVLQFIYGVDGNSVVQQESWRSLASEMGYTLSREWKGAQLGWYNSWRADFNNHQVERIALERFSFTTGYQRFSSGLDFQMQRKGLEFNGRIGGDYQAGYLRPSTNVVVEHKFRFSTVRGTVSYAPQDYVAKLPEGRLSIVSATQVSVDFPEAVTQLNYLNIGLYWSRLSPKKGRTEMFYLQWGKRQSILSFQQPIVDVLLKDKFIYDDAQNLFSRASMNWRRSENLSAKISTSIFCTKSGGFGVSEFVDTYQTKIEVKGEYEIMVRDQMINLSSQQRLNLNSTGPTILTSLFLLQGERSFGSFRLQLKGGALAQYSSLLFVKPSFRVKGTHKLSNHWQLTASIESYSQSLNDTGQSFYFLLNEVQVQRADLPPLSGFLGFRFSF